MQLVNKHTDFTDLPFTENTPNWITQKRGEKKEDTLFMFTLNCVVRVQNPHNCQLTWPAPPFPKDPTPPHPSHPQRGPTNVKHTKGNVYPSLPCWCPLPDITHHALKSLCRVLVRAHAAVPEPLVGGGLRLTLRPFKTINLEKKGGKKEEKKTKRKDGRGKDREETRVSSGTTHPRRLSIANISVSL